ncbi:unnamed protein product, partial [Ectocarpus fasciculatus]
LTGGSTRALASCSTPTTNPCPTSPSGTYLFCGDGRT